MKKHFKLILAALSALLLLFSNTAVVFATGSDKLPDDADENGVKPSDFAYTGTLTGRNSDGSYQTYYFYSNQRVAFVKVSEGYCVLYEPEQYYYRDVWYGKANVKDDFFTLRKNNTFTQGKRPTLTVYQKFMWSPKYETYTATVPIFDNFDDWETYIETGDYSNCLNPDYADYLPDKEWAYSGTISATDSIVSSIEDRTYSLCSDGRLAILNEEEYVYQLYTGTGSSIYEESGGSLTKLSVDGVLWYNLFPMTKYNSYKSTIPIFKVREDLLHYIETGDYTGCTNIGNIGLPTESGMPYMQNVAWSSVADCYGGIPYIMGDKISWAVKNFPWRNGGKVELCGDFEVKVFNNSAAEIAAGLSDTIVFNVALRSEDFEKIGLGFTDFNEGKVILPSDKVQQLLQSKLDSIYGENRYKYVSHKFTNLYVRCVWEKFEEGKILTSRWVKVSPGDSLDNFGHVVTGDIGEIKNGQFTFTEDTESEGSYEYNKDFSGNYPFEKDDNGGINIPTSLEEALSQFVDILGALIKAMGKVPELVKKVFSFIPSVYLYLIGASITVVVILRILGR